jgi:hypothetical protein
MPSQAKPSQAKPSQAKPSQAKPSLIYALLLGLQGSVFAQEPASWLSHNRYIEAAIGERHQDYREFDTNAQTVDGIFNAESGAQSTAAIALRWQTESSWWMHIESQRHTGPTLYRGYLQDENGALTPYNAYTGNVSHRNSIAMGYALRPDALFSATAQAAWGADWQFIPMLQYSQHHWQRNLVQYSETYTHDVYAVGAALQWRWRPGTVLEAQALFGRTQLAHIVVPAFDFQAVQPGGDYREWQLGFSQDLGALMGAAPLHGWRIAMRYSMSSWAHGASEVVDDAQAPPNQHTPSTWMLSLQRQF